MLKPPDSQSRQLAEWIARAAHGDRDAFAALFQVVAPKVKGYLVRLGSPPSAAEDLTQDVLLTVWRKADSFNPAKSAPMTWIFVIARNRRIDSLRREGSTVTYGTTPPDGPDDTTRTAPETMECAEAEDRIRRALAALPPEQRAVIARSFWDEEPHAAIASALGIPLGTVKSRLRLALKRLRAGLEDLQ